MSQLKVLLVGQALGGGGAEKRLRLLGEHMFAGRVDVAVLQSTEGGSRQAHDLGWKSRASYLRVVVRLNRLLKKTHYDAVMSFGMFPIVISVIALWFCKAKPKLIMNEITRPVAQARGCGWLRRSLYLLLQRHFYPLCDVLTANSIDGVIEVAELASCPVSVVRRTPNVAYLDELRGLSLGDGNLGSFGSYFICVARFDHMKRVDTVIEAWRRLAGECEAKLLLVGDGEGSLSLQALVTKHGLESMVLFMGKIDNPMPMIRRATGFILASEYEGFSNSVLEAMCLEVPVITSFCSSDAVQMCAQGAALGFQVGDDEQLASHVRSIVSSAVLGADLVQSAIKYRSPHLLPTSIRAYEKIVEDCVSNLASGID